MTAIPYGRQHISEDDIRAVVEVLRSDYLTQGPKIGEFESAFANYVNAKYAVAVANGTAALHLGALALGVNDLSNVITTPITFVASANCVRYCGGAIHFADIDPNTLLIDLNKVEDILRAKPVGFFQGIIPVHFAGLSVNMSDLRTLSEKFGLWIMEDACHALGGYFSTDKIDKIPCGSCAFSDLSAFSFHPVKHVATGEGGMLTTNDSRLYEKLLELRSHGVTRDPKKMIENHGGWYYEMQELGFNYRLTDMQSALGHSQLKRAAESVDKRVGIAERYMKELADVSEKLKLNPVTRGHAYHLYVIMTPLRDELYAYLKTHNIFCQVHYIPVHQMPYYRSLGFSDGDFPASENYYKQCLSLPMFPSLTWDDQNRVIEKIKEFFNGR